MEVKKWSVERLRGSSRQTVETASESNDKVKSKGGQSFPRSQASSLATASLALRAKADMAARIIEAEVVQLRT